MGDKLLFSGCSYYSSAWENTQLADTDELSYRAGMTGSRDVEIGVLFAILVFTMSRPTLWSVDSLLCRNIRWFLLAEGIHIFGDTRARVATRFFG